MITLPITYVDRLYFPNIIFCKPVKDWELRHKMDKLSEYVHNLTHSPTILVIEDNEHDLFMFNHALGELKGVFKVVSTNTGESAIENLKDRKFDIVFLDLKLDRGLDGIQVLKWLRENRIDTPVVTVSGSENGPLVTEALGLGVVLHLQKPVKSESLRQIFNWTKHES